MPRCVLRRGAAYNTVAITFTGMPYDTVEDGPTSIAKATGVTTTAGFIAPVSGRYLLSARSGIAATTIGDYYNIVAINHTQGISYRGNYMHEYSAAGLDVASFVFVSIRATAGDLLQIIYWANAVRALQLGGGTVPFEQWAMLDYLGP